MLISRRKQLPLMRAMSPTFLRIILVVMAVQISWFFENVSAACSEPCDPVKNPLLYPNSFSVFGAYDGRQFTSGESMLIIAHFPTSTCQLPEPGEAGAGCIPFLDVGVHLANGSNCLSIPAANSTKQAEIEYGIRFISDPSLDTPSGKYNHWIFPFDVVDGMHTAKLSIVGLVIPEACNVRDRVTFFNTNLIPKGNNLLKRNVSIDTLPATIVSVYTGKPAGAYTLGDVIRIGVEFSKSVLFSERPSKYGTAFMSANASYTIPVGLPYLELNSQARALLMGYEAGTSDRRKLSFLYNVGAGEFTPPDGQLDVPAGSTIQLNGGRIAALGTGIEANLTSMPLPGDIGSLSSPFAPKIRITKTGEKFPPHGYDPSAAPGVMVTNTTRRNGQVHVTRRAGKPIVVTVHLQMNAIFDLAEKSQGLKADFTLASSWVDPRLADPKKPSVTTSTTEALDRRLMWGPRLTFLNRRDLSSPTEGVLVVTNRGEVTLIQRFVAAFAVTLNLRDFPFDTQTLTWNIRSAAFNKDFLRFSTAAPEALRNASRLLASTPDPTFVFSDYSQSTYTIEQGIYADFHVLSISFKAARISTMSSTFLIFPLCLVCLALGLVLSQEPSTDARLTVPASALFATMAFSFVISNICPPVSYVTRIHLLVFQTYIFAAVELTVNYYLWRVQAARKELSNNNTSNKTLLSDAHWMPRKILPPPTNVVVLPDGIHKPVEELKSIEGSLLTPAVIAPSSPPFSTVSRFFSFADVGFYMGSRGDVTPSPSPEPSDLFVRYSRGVGGGGDVAWTSRRADASNATVMAAGTGFGHAGGSIVKDAVMMKEKATVTGAYKDKTGAFKDVHDLLESEEVKTFKVLRWGGEPVKAFRGFIEVNNQNDRAWKLHVDTVNHRFNLVYTVLLTISVGCILGVQDLAGLRNPPAPVIGIPDTTPIPGPVNV